MEAIGADPAPVLTSDDVASVETIIALDERRGRRVRDDI
jgi:hypothetical protein